MTLSLMHFPQIPCKPFRIEVDSVDEAIKIADILAFYDLFLLDHGHRADYSNATYIQHSDPYGDGESGDFDPDDSYDMDELREIMKKEKGKGAEDAASSHA